MLFSDFMPSRRFVSKGIPAPLPPGEVLKFLCLLSHGSHDQVSSVRGMLSTTRRLANTKFADNTTPLMVVAAASGISRAILPAATAVELIELLLAHGAALATRGPDRCHVLLYACKHGAPPSVVQCLCQADARSGKDNFRWSHTNEDKNGALVLAACSGNTSLVAHLLTVIDMYGQSNHPLKVLECAIESQSEDLVLFLFKQPVFLNFDWEDSSHTDTCVQDKYGYTGEGFKSSTSMSDCVGKVIEVGMFRALEIMDQVYVGTAGLVWLAHQEHKSTISTVMRENSPVAMISKRYRAQVVWQNLRVLALVRLRGQNCKKMEAPILARVPSDIFRFIFSFFFAFSEAHEIQRLKQQEYSSDSDYGSDNYYYD